MTERYRLMEDLFNPNEFEILDTETGKSYKKEDIVDLLNKQHRAIEKLKISKDQ